MCIGEKCPFSPIGVRFFVTCVRLYLKKSFVYESQYPFRNVVDAFLNVLQRHEMPYVSLRKIVFPVVALVQQLSGLLFGDLPATLQNLPPHEFLQLREILAKVLKTRHQALFLGVAVQGFVQLGRLEVLGQRLQQLVQVIQRRDHVCRGAPWQQEVAW